MLREGSNKLHSRCENHERPFPNRPVVMISEDAIWKWSFMVLHDVAVSSFVHNSHLIAQKVRAVSTWWTVKCKTSELLVELVMGTSEANGSELVSNEILGQLSTRQSLSIVKYTELWLEVVQESWNWRTCASRRENHDSMCWWEWQK